MITCSFTTLLQRLLIGSVVATSLSACGSLSTTPTWDQHVGLAWQQITRDQILYPQAGQQHHPVGGMDGNAAVQAQQAYTSGYAQGQVTQATSLLGKSIN